MKHVVIITNIPAPYRVDFFDYLKKSQNDYEITVIYSSQNEDNRKWEIDHEKLEDSIFLNSKTIKIKKKFDTKYIHIPWGVTKVLEEISPDVVIGSEYNPTIIQALIYCKRNKVPFVSWTDGTLYSERNINLVQKILRKAVIGSASAYIASSTKSREAQLAYGAAEDKCFVSYLTVDLEKYRQVPEGKGLGKILCVGSLIERKGIDLLLRALAHVKCEYQLRLAGDGDERENLRKLSKELGISDKVIFLGQLNRKQLLKEYAESDLFVLPTREDCFALVILEAMCSGLPMICSKYADGAYDLLEEGKNGYIVDPYNKKEFSQRLELLLTDSGLRENMQKNSEEIIKKFEFENVAKEYFAAISKSMEK